MTSNKQPSLKDLDEAMNKLRKKLGSAQQEAPRQQHASSGKPSSTSSEPERPTSALSQQATKILQQIENFDLFAHVQKKISTPAPPPRSGEKTVHSIRQGSSSSRTSSASNQAGPIGDGSEAGCGSNEPIPSDAPPMSDDVMSAYASGGAGGGSTIMVDERGHPGTCYRLVPGVAASYPENHQFFQPKATDSEKREHSTAWEPSPLFVDALRPGRTFVYFDFLLECIRRDMR